MGSGKRSDDSEAVEDITARWQKDEERLIWTIMRLNRRGDLNGNAAAFIMPEIRTRVQAFVSFLLTSCR